MTAPWVRASYPPGHVIHMSCDADGTGETISVAACDCGWKHSTPWREGNYAMQDDAIEAHWREMEK